MPKVADYAAYKKKLNAARAAASAATAAPNLTAVGPMTGKVAPFLGSKFPTTEAAVMSFLKAVGLASGSELRAFQKTGAAVELANKLKKLVPAAERSSLEAWKVLEDVGSYFNKIGAKAGIVDKVKSVFKLVGLEAPAEVGEIARTAAGMKPSLKGVAGAAAGLAGKAGGFLKGLSTMEGAGKAAGTFGLLALGAQYLMKDRSERQGAEDMAELAKRSLLNRPDSTTQARDDMINMLLQQRMLQEAASGGVPPKVLQGLMGAGQAPEPAPVPGAVQL